MNLCCCFCGKILDEYPNYSLVAYKNTEKKCDNSASQELYCHEKCLENCLYNPDILYLKHL